MNAEETIAALDAIDGSDTEKAHGEADGYILKFLSDNGFDAISQAWERVDEKARGFWYA